MSSTAASPPGSWGRAWSELHSAVRRKAPSDQGVVRMPLLFIGFPLPSLDDTLVTPSCVLNAVPGTQQVLIRCLLDERRMAGWTGN